MKRFISNAISRTKPRYMSRKDTISLVTDFANHYIKDAEALEHIHREGLLLKAKDWAEGYVDHSLWRDPLSIEVTRERVIDRSRSLDDLDSNLFNMLKMGQIYAYENTLKDFIDILCK